MENILNYVKEEKAKLDAHYQRIEEESNARKSKVAKLKSDLVEKLKPLETIIIQDTKTTVEPENYISDNTFGSYSEIKINHGKEYKHPQGYTTRLGIKIIVELDKEGPGHHYKLEGMSTCGPSEKKELSMEECLVYVAKYFALYNYTKD